MNDNYDLKYSYCKDCVELKNKITKLQLALAVAEEALKEAKEWAHSEFCTDRHHVFCLKMQDGLSVIYSVMNEESLEKIQRIKEGK